MTTAKFDPKVLIVDDDDFVRASVGKKLMQIGAHVVEAADGMEAFKILRQESFDFAIVDIEMPILSGLELLGCIRSYEPIKHMPVIVLTGSEDLMPIRRALECGATSVLVKPLDWRTFRAHIEHIAHLAVIGRQALRAAI